MNNIDDYKNLIEVLKQALIFYANKNNYFTEKNAPITMIDLDEHGSQARFALSKIVEIEELYKKMNDEYIENINQEFDEKMTNEDFLKVLEKVKNNLK